jgi:hypothetical protein
VKSNHFGEDLIENSSFGTNLDFVNLKQ